MTTQTYSIRTGKTPQLAKTLGWVRAESPAQARDRAARSMGCDDYAHLCECVGDDEPLQVVIRQSSIGLREPDFASLLTECRSLLGRMHHNTSVPVGRGPHGPIHRGEVSLLALMVLKHRGLATEHTAGYLAPTSGASGYTATPSLFELPSGAHDRLLRCIANLQDPAVTDHNGERRVTFSIGNHYSTFPEIVVNQSGGVYTTARQLLDDLRAVGGSITVGYGSSTVPYYRVSLAPDREHREGADILIDDLTVSTAVAPADFAAAREAYLRDNSRSGNR